MSKMIKLDPLWHVQIVLLLTVVMQLALPGYLIRGPRILVAVLELVLVFGLRLATPEAHTFQSKTRRTLVVIIIALLGIVNATSLELLVKLILYGDGIRGPQLILSGLNIAITNVVVFALWYWEMDGGGPGKRRTGSLRSRDFMFTQMSNPELAASDWFPTFIDYFYVSSTNALAFSPTDTLPLTRRAKMLMLLQSFISISTIALVVARAVNILH